MPPAPCLGPCLGGACYSCSSSESCSSQFSQTMSDTFTSSEREIDVDDLSDDPLDCPTDLLSPDRAQSVGYIHFPSVSCLPYNSSLQFLQEQQQLSSTDDSSIPDSGIHKLSFTMDESLPSSLDSDFIHTPQAPENSPTSTSGDSRESFSSSHSSLWVASPQRFCLLHQGSDSPCSITTGRRSSVSSSDCYQPRARLPHHVAPNPLDTTYLEPLGVRPPCIGKESSPAVCPTKAASTSLPEPSAKANRVTAWLADVNRHQKSQGPPPPPRTLTSHRSHRTRCHGYMSMDSGTRKRHSTYANLPQPRRKPTGLETVQELENNTLLHLAEAAMVSADTHDMEHGIYETIDFSRMDHSVTSDATHFMKQPLNKPAVTGKLTPSRRRMLAKKLKKIGRQIQRSGAHRLNLLAVV